MSAERTPVTAIVLAGGRASRYGSDKLAVQFGGRSLLAHAVAGVAPVAADILVVIPPLGDAPRLPARAGGRPINFVRDPEPYGGPLVALLAGLERSTQPLAVAVGGDMPRLATPVLAALIRLLESTDDADVAVLGYRGRRQPLPMALRVGVATTVARRRLAEGERSLVALLSGVRVRELAETAWRPLDPGAATLTDVDRPDDLPVDRARIRR